MPKKKKYLVLKFFLGFIFLLAAAGGIIAYKFYNMIYQPNVVLGEKKTEFFYIRTGSTLHDVVNSLYEKNYILNRNSFEWVAEKKKFKNNIHPGRYLIKSGMNNDELINLLRSGKQEPLRVTFNNIRLKHELASAISLFLEADSSAIMKLLEDENYCRNFGFNKENILCMFIPNTYEFFWNTSAEQFFERMKIEYDKFWNDERKTKAKNIGLTEKQVSVLASIVQNETHMNDEKPRVAGVYINRIKKDMLLQADPTLIFALKDFSIKRVLNIHKETESPYNTYKYKGLPPGPICIPEISSLDAVLNYEKHDYFYFCAKDDFSGYHNFAKTYAQHCINANSFQKALNKKKIYNANYRMGTNDTNYNE